MPSTYAILTARTDFLEREWPPRATREVIESDPPGVFDKAAIRAVSRWRFKPRMVNGRAVPGKATQVVDFKLEK